MVRPFASWSLRRKMGALLLAASLLPLGVAAFNDINESQQLLLASTEALLRARGDQLVVELDAENAGYQISAARFARLPGIHAFCRATGANAEALKGPALEELAVHPATDPNVRGAAILGPSGVVELATERELVGVDLSGQSYVRDAMRGSPVVSNIHLAGPELGNTPTVAYLQPVRELDDAVRALVVLWVKAESLWAKVKASNALAGPDSFAVLFDHLGVRIGHTYNQEMVFHPAGALEPGLVASMVTERRFGQRTRELIDDVRPFPDQFTRARDAWPDQAVFRGFAPVNQKWNYGVGRRLATVSWTVFYMIPEEGLGAQVAEMTRRRLLFAGVIMLAALFAGVLVARSMLRPLKSLTIATKAIGGGDLSARVWIDRTDELGRLGESFNAMAVKLEGQAAALLRAREGLELRVRARTEDLVETTASLTTEMAVRRRAEIKVEDREEDLRITLHSIGDAVIATNSSGSVTRMNPVAEQLTGWKTVDAVGRNLSEIFQIINEETREPVDSPVERALREGSVATLAKQTLLVSRDGSERAIADSSAPIRDAEGKLRGVVLVFRDQTAERKASRALQRSESRFRRLAESGIIGITLSDASGKVLEANDAFLAMVGYSRADFLAGELGRELLDDRMPAGAPEGGPRRVRDDEPISGTEALPPSALRRQGVASAWEKELVHKDGSLVPVLLGAARVEGSPEENIAFIVDRTKYKRAEDALRASERRFRAIQESGIIGICLVDGAGMVKEANHAFLSLAGYTQAELIAGKLNRQTLNTPESALTDSTARLEVATTGAHVWEKEILRKDGSRVPILAGLVTVDETTEESVAFILDLTEQKRAESAARQSEARKAAVMEAALDGIVLMDHEGKITDFNPAAERLFGHSHDDVIGRSLAEVIVPPHLRDAYRAGLERHLETGGMTILGKRIEVPARRKNGSEFPAEIAVVRIRSEGAPVFTGYIRDLTERHQAAEAELLRREKEAAQAANRELEAFSYSVAHDLRAPLRAINGFASALKEDYSASLDDEAKDLLLRVMTSAERMAQIIDALLSLARLSRTELRSETVDLSQLARTIFDQLHASQPTRQVEDVVSTGVVAKGDPRLLRIVLENLLGNAWKFTQNQATARIEFGCTSLPDGPVYFVRDNGAGFDATYAGKLFSPFQRLHSTTEFEGTGVGLATVKRIIDRHGGRVWAEGKENEGATFQFRVSNAVSSSGSPSPLPAAGISPR